MTARSPRLAPLGDEEMTAAQARMRDMILAGPRGALVGPDRYWIRQPGLSEGAFHLGSHVRFASSLAPELRELAILVTGRLWRSLFEWQAHVRIAREAGLPESVIEALRARQTPRFEDPKQAAVYDLAMALLVDRAVTQALYDRAVETLGVEGVLDVIATTGFYTMVSMTLNTFDIPGLDPDARDFE